MKAVQLMHNHPTHVLIIPNAAKKPCVQTLTVRSKGFDKSKSKTDWTWSIQNQCGENEYRVLTSPLTREIVCEQLPECSVCRDALETQTDGKVELKEGFLFSST